MKDCIFCKIASGEILVKNIYENENFFAIKDANQKVEGHSLIISKKHYTNFIEMPHKLYREALECAKTVAEKLKIKDFNLVINNGNNAGQIVKHFHLHILPRKYNDGFELGI